ncbi:MAG TPA: hypothetical protein DCG75_14175 [Bacteroidales bacterium]|jgi:hypothetical protein|nr:hypothetical protein [Bacteroidales bacterium]
MNNIKYLRDPIYKGKLNELISFFNASQIGETFENAFQGRKSLKVGEEIISYDFIYKLYRSSDGLYVLFMLDL